MSTDGWIRKCEIYIFVYYVYACIYMCICIHMYVCIYMYVCVFAEEYYLALMKKEILTFVTTWMKLEGIIQSEVQQREIRMFSFICGIQKPHRDYSECQGGGGNVEMLVKRSKRPVTRGISSRCLMYSVVTKINNTVFCVLESC